MSIYVVTYGRIKICYLERISFIKIKSTIYVRTSYVVHSTHMPVCRSYSRFFMLNMPVFKHVCPGTILFPLRPYSALLYNFQVFFFVK